MSGERSFGHWRPLTVSRPKPLEDVLVTAIDAGERTVYMLSLDHLGRWHWSGDGELFDSGYPSHWMPLPEPAPR